MENGKKIVVLYHRNCQDGSMAGFLLYHYFSLLNEYNEVEAIAVNYGDALLDLSYADELYIVDFSYKINDIRNMVTNYDTNRHCRYITMLDHHQTAIDIYGKEGSFSCSLTAAENDAIVDKSRVMIHLDNNLSGCQLALQYIKNDIGYIDERRSLLCDRSRTEFINNPRIAEVVRHIGQRDRWIFESEYTYYYYELFKDVKYDDFDTYYKYLVLYSDEQFFAEVEKAKNYYTVKENLAQKYAKLFSLIDFQGYKNVPIVNVPSDFSSRVGEILYTQGYPLAIMYCLNKDKVFMSLRSSKDVNPVVNVKELCERFHGGGHVNSAGFSIEPKELIRMFNNEYC